MEEILKDKVSIGDEVYIEYQSAQDEFVRTYVIILDNSPKLGNCYFGYAGREDMLIGVSRDKCVKTGKHFDSIPLDYRHED